MVKYPVFVMAGRDIERREIMDKLDPEEKYTIKAELPFLGKRVVDYVLDELVQCKNVDVVSGAGPTSAKCEEEPPNGWCKNASTT